MHTAFECLGVFTAAAVLDFAHLRWTAANVGGSSLQCAGWSTVVGAVGLLSIAGALSGWYAGLAYCCGGFVGSYASAYLSRKRRMQSIG